MARLLQPFYGVYGPHTIMCLSLFIYALGTKWIFFLLLEKGGEIKS